MIELVAITRVTEPPPPAPLRAIAVGPLAAVVAPASGGEDVSAEALWRREELVEQLMADRDLLPVRYGTRFSEDEEAARAVAGQRASLTAALDRVCGAVEFAVRAPAEVLDELRALARDVVVQQASAAYLVDRSAADAFAARIAELDVSSVTGPWPPYSFTQAPGALPARRIGADPENVERGLAQLVLTIVELLRQLMERQALRRIDAGGLSDEQIERMGTTFMELDKRMAELREVFDVTQEDLNLDLGPLGRLI